MIKETTGFSNLTSCSLNLIKTGSLPLHRVRILLEDQNLPIPDFSTIPTDDELQLRIKNFEDHFIERKTLGDSKDWLKKQLLPSRRKAFLRRKRVSVPPELSFHIKTHTSRRTAECVDRQRTNHLYR